LKEAVYSCFSFCLPPANLLICYQSLIATILSFSLSAPSSWTPFSYFFLVSLISQFPSHIIGFFHHAAHLLPVDFWKFLFYFTFIFLSSHVSNPSNFACSDGGVWIYHHSLTTSNAINMIQRNRLAPSSPDPCDFLTFVLLARNKAILALSTLFTLGILLVLFCVCK